MICPACQQANPTGARFCVQCGVSLNVRCSNCQTQLPPGSRFCMSCGQPVGSATPEDEARHARLASAAPEALAEKLRSAHAMGEQRVVTVLFLDVASSAAPAQRVGAEVWSRIMNGALDRIVPAIYRYEGTVARLMGDGLWAFFGAPVAHEDDPVRAVRAALDAVQALRGYASEVRREYGIELAVRACLSTGPVVIGPVGSDLRYEASDPARSVNLAAWLKSAAEPMTVVIAQDTYRFVAPLFDCVSLGSVEVPNMTQPVRLYAVRGTRAEPGPVRGLEGLKSPMVGRDDELATLLRLHEAVRAGLGRAVVVVGEPGLGKTRLISEWRSALLAARAQPGPRWVEARCLSYGQRLAHHLLIDLLRSLIGVPERAGDAATEQALLDLVQQLFRAEQGARDGNRVIETYAFLAHVLMLRLEGEALDCVLQLDPQALQAQVVIALKAVLLALAARQPLVLVLEDIHWADPSSAELLARLLPLAISAPILFCLVARPDRDAPGWRLVSAARETLGGSLTEIWLTPLQEADSRRLVSNLLRIEALPDPVRSLILKKAEGNPFFVEEVIRMLIDRHAIQQRDSGWVAAAEIDAVDIPDNLQGLLLARIDRLPEEGKRLLRVAAVIGRRFPVRVLQSVLEGAAPT